MTDLQLKNQPFSVTTLPSSDLSFYFLLFFLDLFQIFSKSDHTCMKSFKTKPFSKVNFRSVTSVTLHKTLYNDAKTTPKSKGLLVLESLWTFRLQNHLDASIKTDFRDTALISVRISTAFVTFAISCQFQDRMTRTQRRKHYFNDV